MAKQIKVEWCENWIRAKFKELPEFANAFECFHFWDMAEKSGLYVNGTYGKDAPMSEAISNLCEIKDIYDEDHRKILYSAFKLKGT